MTIGHPFQILVYSLLSMKNTIASLSLLQTNKQATLHVIGLVIFINCTYLQFVHTLPNILSHASEAGSPKNRPGSGPRRDTGC